MTNQASRLGSAYREVYDWLCGKHTNPRPWHFQWLSSYYLRRELEIQLPTLHGSVLDVGCGMKPYASLMTNVNSHLGIDIQPGPNVDLVVEPDQQWGLENSSFDAVISTQVLEHVENLEQTLAEMERVTVPGGTVILSVPFIYNEHGAPGDFRRFSIYGTQSLLPSMTITHSKKQGGIGSTIGTLLLNWVDASLNLSFATRLLKAAVLPIWIPSCLVLNLVALAIDKADRTGAFYNNVFIVYKAE
ncbi:MAG: class I SAM-dependent methyltransferase [Pseudomonadales bacterium]